MRLWLVIAIFICMTAYAADDPIRNEASEQAKIDNTLADGGLPPVIGVRNYQVFRASRDVPEITDGKGWTYNHHMDLAHWQGRLYVAWDNGEKDEDVWPSREVYSTSEDGVTWSPPKELFPQGISTSLRMYFFHAPNGRMLAIAGLRWSQEKLKEELKRGAVVREIKSDHTLGDVFTLISDARVTNAPPLFSTSSDKDFVQACEQLLANRSFLETQDYGVLLGDRKMKWHDVAASDRNMRTFGKAFSFFHRGDGALVGIAKKGWAIVSTDEGENWSQPVIPESLVTNNAKVWGTRTPDGRFALVFNPKPEERFPLAMITGDDGITFNTMRIVHGEVPNQRYEGGSKNIGAQYVRGVSEWTSDEKNRDGDGFFWVVYSMNKEDIWVSRIPTLAPSSGWSIYSPKWAPVNQPDDGVQLEDRDPYDYARAQYSFPESAKVSAEFTVQAEQVDRGRLEIELFSMFGDLRPVGIVMSESGKILAGDKELATYVAKGPIKFQIDADATKGRFSVKLNNKAVVTDLPLAEAAHAFQRLSFRTGEYRALGKKEPVAAGSDKPSDPIRFSVRAVSVK
jgi:hypothetical protein